MKRFMLCITAVLLFGTGAMSQITNFPYTQGFENGLDGWRSLDLDGDGFVWAVSDANADNGFGGGTMGMSQYVRSGQNYVYSASYDGRGLAVVGQPFEELTPDNLLVSPAITVTGNMVLKYWYRPVNDELYFAEHLGVYISTTTDDAATILSSPVVQEFTCEMEDAQDYHSRTISLAQYAGQTIYIAFRHFNCMGLGEIYLDDIYIGEPRDPEVSLVRSAEVDLNTALPIFASYAGSTDGLTFTWQSRFNDQGNANLVTNGQSATITYYREGMDSVKVTARNSYGVSEAAMAVQIRHIDPVTTYPFVCGFENTDELEGVIYDNEVNGWCRGAADASEGHYSMYVSHNGGISNTYNPMQQSISYTTRYFQIDEPGTYTYSYDWKSMGEPGYDYMRIIMMPAGVLLSARQLPAGMITGNGPVPQGMYDLSGELSGNASWSHRDGTFDVLTPGLYKITYMWVNESSSGTSYNNPESIAAAVDNFRLSFTSCLAPYDLTLDSLGGDFIAVHWTPGGSETQWLVKVNETDVRTVNTPSLRLSNLSPMTTYNIKVYATCGVSDTSLAISGTWNTPCVPITNENLPYIEDFENFIAHDCWNLFTYRGGTRGTSSPSINNGLYAQSGITSLEFFNFGSNEPVYGVLPFVQDLSRVNFEFSIYVDDVAQTIKVGVMTDPNDTSSFTTLETIRPTAAFQWRHYEVSLSAYTGSGRYVAIRTNGTYNSTFVDDVKLTLQPACPRPSVVRVIEVTESTAKLEIVGPVAAESYEIVYTADGRTGSITSTETLVELTGLTGATTYSVEVYSNCPGEPRTTPARTTFRTLMVAATVPYSTSFENGEDRGWLTMNDGTGNGWYVGNADSYTGSHALYISQDGGTTASYNQSQHPAVSYAMRSFKVMQTGDMAYSFDWRGKGEANCDFMRAWLVVGVPELTAGEVPASIANNVRNGNPIGWTDMCNGQMQDAAQWQHVTGEYTVYDTGYYTMVFMWKNDAAAGNNPAACIDNVNLVPLTCVTPTNLVFDEITTDAMTFHWTPGSNETSWLVMVNNSRQVVHNPEYSVQNLTPATAYRVSVAGICFVGDTSLPLTAQVRTHMAAATIPYYTGFEPSDDRGWYFSNATSKWMIGSAEHYAGNYALYVSSNQGSTASYNYTSGSVSYATRLIYVDHPGPIDVSYDWKCLGETGSDFMRIWLAPGAYDPVDNELPIGVNGYTYRGNPTGWIDLGNDMMSGQSLWDYRATNAIVPTTGYYTLVVMWNNDNATGHFPGGVLDELSIAYSSCATPTRVVFDTVGAYALGFHWSHGGSEERWVVSCGDETRVTTDTFAFFSPVQASHRYQVTVRSLCGVGDTSVAASNTALTLCGNMELPFAEDFSQVTTGGYIIASGKLPCWTMYTGRYDELLGTATLVPVTSRDVFERSIYSLGGKTNLKFTVCDQETGWLVTPPIVLDAYANLSFKYALTSYSNANPRDPSVSVADDRFYVLVSKDDGATWRPLIRWGNGAGYDYDFGSISHTGDSISMPMPEYAGYTVRIAFYAASSVSNSTNDLHIGDIRVVRDNSMPPICMPPTITNSTVTTSSATVYLTGSADYYELACVTGDWAEPESGIETLDGSAVSHTFYRLHANTNYTIGVRSVCESGMRSRWSTVSVRTNDNGELPCYTPTNLHVDGDPGFTSVTLDWTPMGSEHFWECRLRCSANGTDVTKMAGQHPFVISDLSPCTVYTLQIRAYCGTNSQSEYSGEITFQTSCCSAVTMVSHDPSSWDGHSITINWTPAEGSSGNYNVEWGHVGFPRGSGRQDVAFQRTSYTISNLDADTEYEVCVQSICNTSSSDWTCHNFSTVGIEDVENSRIALRPNPATSNVTLSGIEGKVDIELIDLRGKVIESYQADKNTYTINVSDLPAGAYFVRVVGERVNAIRKLIVK